MTTTELIQLLKDNEFSEATGQVRTVHFEVNGECVLNPSLEITEMGCGIGGADMTLPMEDGELPHIVRCADCKYWHVIDLIPYCDYWHIRPKYDGFCSEGKTND